jgi:hypothetical protein
MQVDRQTGRLAGSYRGAVSRRRAGQPVWGRCTGNSASGGWAAPVRSARVPVEDIPLSRQIEEVSAFVTARQLADHHSTPPALHHGCSPDNGSFHQDNKHRRTDFLVFSDQNDALDLATGRRSQLLATP